MASKKNEKTLNAEVNNNEEAVGTVHIGDADTGLTEEEYYKLTDEEYTALRKTLAESNTPETQFLRDMPSNNGVMYSDGAGENIQKESNVSVDAISGSITIDGADEELSDIDKELARMLEINPDELFNIPESVSDFNIEPEYIEKAIKDTQMGKSISDEDTKTMIELTLEYHGCKDKDKINWYNKLPSDAKRVISCACKEVGNYSTSAKKLFASELLEEISRSAGLDRIVIDFQKEMSKAFNIAPVVKMSLNKASTELEVQLAKKRDAFIEQGNAEKAEKFQNIIDSYRESYLFTKFIEVAKTGKLRVKKFDINKMDRFIIEFNHKYENDTPFAIYDCACLYPILIRQFSDKYSPENISVFIISFIKYTKNMSSKDVADHTFMSYVVSNIRTMDISEATAASIDESQKTFSNVFRENLDKAIDAANIGSRIGGYGNDNNHSKK